jgi:alkylation response protein AidB-like acyl-CoA dehydrogenase
MAQDSDAADGDDDRLAAAMFPSILDLPFFEDRHRALAARLDAWAGAELPEEPAGSVLDHAREIGRRLAAGGWFRLLTDAAGAGVPDVRSLCLAREVLARHDGLADFVFALQGLGSAPVLLFGSEAQRAAYIPGVIAGARLPAFALSEQQSGSDAAGIQTRAERRGDAFVLNGAKAWISNAGIADFYVVFARTGEAPGARGLSAFIVDADNPGLRVSEQVPVIAPHVIAALEFTDCVVPRGRLLGEPGEGFKIAMTVLDVYRSTVGAAALGFARRAFQETVAHVRRRRLFGQPLADFQATRMRLAEMATALESAALLVYRSAWTKDVKGGRVTYPSSLAKMAATEQAQSVIDSAVQLFGGEGVRQGSVIERLYREIRPLRIYEGATEIQKIVIADQLLRQWEALTAMQESGTKGAGERDG